MFLRWKRTRRKPRANQIPEDVNKSRFANFVGPAHSHKATSNNKSNASATGKPINDVEHPHTNKSQAIVNVGEQPRDAFDLRTTLTVPLASTALSSTAVAIGTSTLGSSTPTSTASAISQSSHTSSSNSAAPSPPSTMTDDSTSSSHTGAVIASIIAGLLIMLMLLAFICRVRKLRHESRRMVPTPSLPIRRPEDNLFESPVWGGKELDSKHDDWTQYESHPIDEMPVCLSRPTSLANLSPGLPPPPPPPPPASSPPISAPPVAASTRRLSRQSLQSLSVLLPPQPTATSLTLIEESPSVLSETSNGVRPGRTRVLASYKQIRVSPSVQTTSSEYPTSVQTMSSEYPTSVPSFGAVNVNARHALTSALFPLAPVPDTPQSGFDGNGELTPRIAYDLPSPNPGGSFADAVHSDLGMSLEHEMSALEREMLQRKSTYNSVKAGIWIGKGGRAKSKVMQRASTAMPSLEQMAMLREQPNYRSPTYSLYTYHHSRKSNDENAAQVEAMPAVY